MHETVGSLAVFGGTPRFANTKPFATLAAPPFAIFRDAVHSQWQSGVLGGYGPYARALEERLADIHRVRNALIITNACVGLVLLMRMFASGRRGNVVIPTFSYSGLPHVTRWAGQTPRFSDVNRQTHALDSSSIETQIDDHTTAVLAVVNPYDFSFMPDLSMFASRRGLPLIFDSVNALGGWHSGVPLGPNGDVEIFSLHATKMLNGFEGGYITTNNDELASEFRARRDAIDAYVNEMHCAMALLSLDGLAEVIERNQAKYQLYTSESKAMEHLQLLPYRPDHQARYNYAAALFDVSPDSPLTRDDYVKILRAEGAAINAYYSPSLHRSSHLPPGMIVAPLPNAEELSTRFFYAPSGERTSIADVRAVLELLKLISEHADDVSERLRAA